jgi:hypothetical protein
VVDRTPGVGLGSSALPAAFPMPQFRGGALKFFAGGGNLKTPSAIN